jgi:hypothetical protein
MLAYWSEVIRRALVEYFDFIGGAGTFLVPILAAVVTVGGRVRGRGWMTVKAEMRRSAGPWLRNIIIPAIAVHLLGYLLIGIPRVNYRMFEDERLRADKAEEAQRREEERATASAKRATEAEHRAEETGRRTVSPKILLSSTEKAVIGIENTKAAKTENTVELSVVFKNFGNAPTTAQIAPTLFLDSVPVNLVGDAPRQFAMPPGHSLTFTVGPPMQKAEEGTAVWEGRRVLEIQVDVVYETEPRHEVRYVFRGRLNGTTHQIDTLRSSWAPSKSQQ